MPAAMRSASICVLPEPAPASTRMLVPRSSRNARRDASSERGFTAADVLGMRGQPSERLQLRIRELAFRCLVHGPAARRLVVAPLASLLVRRVDERTVHDHLTQVAEYGRGLRQRRRRDMHALPSSLVAGEVVTGAGHLGVPVARAQELDRSQAVEGMLKPPAAVERPFPIVAPEAAGLVVQNLELGRAN